MATAEELLGPVTGELVILHFKATHCSKRGNSIQGLQPANPTLSGLAGSGGGC